jgi:hypothetical protein
VRPIAKVSLLCLVLVLAASIGLTAAAAAKDRGKQRKAHLSSGVVVNTVGVDGASGQVTSAGRACHIQRHVTLYRVNSESSVSSGEPVASTWTGAEGTWSVPGPLYSSDFFAVVDRTRARGAICESATSNLVRVG